ncbi:MAG: TetR family transcriptional regulator, partial [Sphingomonas sp.]|nr:TetR family transcriptional regulator [Sphingomonas sp.]
MSIVRRRLSPEESRDAALEAARALLLEAGPQAVTLKAVAARIGRTHANLLHHFGSAAGLQKALIASMADTIVGTIAAAVMRARTSDHDPREVVDLTFDAFGKEGAGALASWMILSGNEDALDPILEAIHGLVDGQVYFVIKTSDPNKVELAATYEDAAAGRAIDIGTSGTSGS